MQGVKVAGVLAVLAGALGGCSERAETYTLYRNTALKPEARIHWATFDASESSPAYNAENCAMALDLLNKNVGALNGGEHPVRFWCEEGKFKA